MVADWGGVGWASASEPVADQGRDEITLGICDTVLMAAGTKGVFSQRFVDAIGDDFFQGFSLLPSQLNGVGYYCLGCESQNDCFDHANATYEAFRSNPASEYVPHFQSVRSPHGFGQRIPFVKPYGDRWCNPTHGMRLRSELPDEL